MSELIVQAILSGIMMGGVYAMVAVGLNLIFGVMKIINFAQGEFIMLGMYITYFAYTLWGLDPYLSVIISAPILAFFGALFSRYAVTRVTGALTEQQIFLTFGLALTLQNFALLSWKADYKTILLPVSYASFTIGGLVISLPRFIAFITALSLTALLFVFLKSTYLGASLRAVAQNREAAMSLGVDPVRVSVIAFSIGAALSGVAGTLLMVFFPAFPMVGFGFGVLAYIIVIMGTLGNLFGSLVGGLVIGIVETVGGFLLGPALKEVLLFTIFILILIVRPEGLFGRRMRVL